MKTCYSQLLSFHIWCWTPNFDTFFCPEKKNVLEGKQDRPNVASFSFFKYIFGKEENEPCRKQPKSTNWRHHKKGVCHCMLMSCDGSKKWRRGPIKQQHAHSDQHVTETTPFGCSFNTNTAAFTWGASTVLASMLVEILITIWWFELIEQNWLLELKVTKCCSFPSQVSLTLVADVLKLGAVIILVHDENVELADANQRVVGLVGGRDRHRVLPLAFAVKFPGRDNRPWRQKTTRRDGRRLLHPGITGTFDIHHKNDTTKEHSVAAAKQRNPFRLRPAAVMISSIDVASCKNWFHHTSGFSGLKLGKCCYLQDHSLFCIV